MHQLGSGCAIPLTYNMWKVYAPNLILHTVLFMATTWPAVQMSGRGTNAPLLFRLTQDGGVFFIMVFGAAIWATAGSVQNKDEAVMLSATYSDLIMSVPSVCVSRLMFSIRSLAAALDTDADTLLSAAELSRVRWRRGLHPGEIFVDVESVEDERAQYPRDTHVGTFELDSLSTHLACT
ncbi:hypothetical protein WOLCODRAFT_164557 [Wolfiporia cocos MD-104 SS10]|uniref:Uncharacterized protein n=1 Tax=Wolfiporia cocos (strain MD-104) TaxID=742152 RepID=A0A2H3JN23_WOLCO|nr:hypothetical protein WOLCODRAFT_164557 [Wolfiporia cocos MD-104 SS10]